MKARSLFLILAVAAAFLRSPVLAGEVQVTTHADDGSNGSLRWAIENAASGDTITFAAALAGYTIILTSGELLIEKSVVILGPGPDKLAINGNATSRVFHVSSNIVVSISGLTITNGLVSDDFWPWKKGGGIYNDHSILTVSDCTVSGNSTGLGGGGGIYNDGGEFGSATLTVSSCTISSNSTERGGGGIFSDGHDSGSATLTVSNCTVSGNSADFGGGIESWESATTIIASAVCNNNASIGGGIFNDDGSLLKVIASTIYRNSTTSSGGGIWNDTGTALLALSTVWDNSAGDNGGGIYNVAWSSDLEASLWVESSTISGNSAVNFGGGVFNRGVNGHAKLTLLASTVSSNSVGVTGGSIFNTNGVSTGSAMVAIANTILKAGASGENLGNIAGTITSLGFNLSSDDASAFLNQATDKNAVDPKLGPLQNNGGPTPTHALLCGSPALDAGTNFTVSAIDQRGLARTFDDPNNANVGDGTDIGAFELDRVTAPTVICPPNQSANATSSLGAIVEYPSAVLDPCGPVAIGFSKISRAFFPIGDTTVFIAFTNRVGNSNACSFNVHVKGAVEQINDLIGKVNTLTQIKAATSHHLLVKLEAALKAADSGHTATVCHEMTDFIHATNAQKEKQLVPASIADDLIANGARIKDVLGCR